MNIQEDDIFYYDEQQASRVIHFIETHIKHIKGELGGKPFELLPFQKKIVSDLFGWRYRETGLRRFRTA